MSKKQWGMRIDKFGLNSTVFPSRLDLFFLAVFFVLFLSQNIEKQKKRRPRLCGSSVMKVLALELPDHVYLYDIITKDSIEKLNLIGHRINQTQHQSWPTLVSIAWLCLGTWRHLFFDNFFFEKVFWQLKTLV